MPKKRIIFVGIHYKPGMDALDSKTKSGKQIDSVIRLLDTELPGCMTKKTNLLTTEFLPSEWNPELEAHQWAIRENFNAETDVIVALGNIVQSAFKLAKFKNVVRAQHPSRVTSELMYKWETLKKIQSVW
jgi:hypothetical protein